jgi:hypothetical protein
MIKHLLISFLALSITATAQAGIISGSIDDSNSLPMTFIDGTLKHNTNIFLYREQENFLLESDLNVDYFGSTKVADSISAGTLVNSFFLNFNPIGTAVDGTSLSASGIYLFDTEILGIIWSGQRPPLPVNPPANFEPQPNSSELLDESDKILGLTGTTYAIDSIGRGLEVENFFSANNSQDTVTVSNFGRQLDLTLFAKPAYADQLRVITAVPEPSTLVLFGAAALCLLNLRRVS